MMKLFKRILLVLLIIVVVSAILFLICIGPWPVRGPSDFTQKTYYKEAIAAIDAHAANCDIAEDPTQLLAGWATRIMTPNVGVPMGGYSARPDGKKSRGVRDELKARAIALSDGTDTVVILGLDMLIVPPNLAELTVNKVAEKTPLTSDDLYFTASHTHCGPGAFGPGLASKISAGKYDPAVPEFLASTFADAIVEAYNSMKPAQYAHGFIDAPEHIRNRTRQAEVDSFLNYMVVEQEGGKRCYVCRWSAHPTIFGTDMMEFSAEFPGEMTRFIEAKTNATAMYLGGGLGSMSPRAPDAPTPSERVKAYGQLLGELVVENTEELEFMNYVDVASVRVPVGVPPAQARPLSPSWRLSPIASKILGVPQEGWIQGARVGSIILIGMPFDTSGELTREWHLQAKESGWDLWVTSFSGAYLGYLSPDRYYNDLDKHGVLDYEVGLMGWLGPRAESYFASLMKRIVDNFGTPPVDLAQAAAVASP
ncbi:MAG: neutral/alkaline non-lysosomal ceramidase N-terminal domain-containing protein [Candidatus Hydrogenedentales bacterium]|jgi:neutral ceramidase